MGIDIQDTVVSAKIKDGYIVIGNTKSLLNGLKAVLIQKGKHFMVINTLGYDEHINGKTWGLYE